MIRPLTFLALAVFCASAAQAFSFASQALTGEVRAIVSTQLPNLYSPAASRPATADEMQTGAVDYLDHTPWAMPHMGYKTGMLATRPRDIRFMALATLAEKEAYTKTHDLRAVLAVNDLANRQRQIDQLSPAEKYDLVVGDLDAHFTRAVWAEVDQQFAHGTAPGWLGLCDGSSSASVLFTEPAHSVRVPSRLAGVAVSFDVGDLKSLLAFSMTTYVAKDLSIFGQRCVGMDADGHDCIGINPASLHELLLEMGENPQNFPYMIIDRSPKTSIWNAALLSASFSYYDPTTNTAVSNIASENKVDVSAYKAPAGSPGWAPGTKYLLFAATVLHLADTRTAVAYNDSAPMSSMDLTLDYVLELDEHLHLLGGEWLTPEHPGFIWALPRDYRPHSQGDVATIATTWVGTAIPDSAMPSIIQSSQNLQPVFRILDFIYQQSK